MITKKEFIRDENFEKNIIVFDTIEKGIKFVDSVIKTCYDQYEIKNIIYTSNLYSLELHNGQVFKVVPCGSNARGHRCDRLFHYKDIDHHILNRVFYRFILTEKNGSFVKVEDMYKLEILLID